MRPILVLILFALLAAAQAGEALRVVAGHAVIHDLAQRIAGPGFEMHCLIPPGGEAHAYRPSPEDVRRLSAAHLVLINGLGFEGWFEPLTREAKLPGRIVAVTAGIEPLPAGGCPCGHEGHDHHGDHAKADRDHGHKHDHDDEHEHHDHGTVDPHAWNSIRQGVRYAENIRDALLALAPEEARPGIRSRAEALIAELRRADAWAVAELAAIPAARRIIVTSHDALAYFARDYGFRVVAPLGTLEDSQPSARELARIVDEIRRLGVPAVFPEGGKNPRLVEQIAREAGVRLAGELYLDGLGPPGSPASDYLATFRHNVRTIAQALR